MAAGISRCSFTAEALPDSRASSNLSTYLSKAKNDVLWEIGIYASDAQATCLALV